MLNVECMKHIYIVFILMNAQARWTQFSVKFVFKLKSLVLHLSVGAFFRYFYCDSIPFAMGKFIQIQRTDKIYILKK